VTGSDRYPSSETLLEQAVAQTGLSDYGTGDFREGLGVLLESLAHDARLSPSTDEEVVGVLRRRLASRLRIEAWYREHPEIDELPVYGPVDVIGLPRTGTTALGSMLSLDPQFRGLRMWEQREPCPPPRLADEAEDPRRRAYARENDELPAEAKAMHLYELDATVEDSDILGMGFHGQQYTLPVYGYHAWWRQADSSEAFAYHRRAVKLLQSQRPPYLWLFKAPHHKFHLEALLSAYPEARFVMTHRDPAKAVPSYASFVSSIFPATTGALDLTRLGREVSEHLRIGMENAMAARGRIGEDRFLDVHHVELIADPLGTVRRVYEFLGLDLDHHAELMMNEWQAANRSGAHGAHHYELAEFGLRAEQIHDEYDFYIEHFAVEVEGTR
jgi:Sulfotransferase family